MIQITEWQMQALNDACDVRRATRIARAMRKFFADRFSGHTDEQTHAFALQCLNQARLRGLRTEGEAHRYANLAALLGIGFEDTPAAHDTGLAPRAVEVPGIWLRRVGDRVEQMLREREKR